jgi:hypothetical protein
MKSFMYCMVVPAGLRPNASRKARMFYLAMVQLSGWLSFYRWLKIMDLETKNRRLESQLVQARAELTVYEGFGGVEVVEPLWDRILGDS